MASAAHASSRRSGKDSESDWTLRKFGLKLSLFVTFWGALFFNGEWTHYGYWMAGWSLVLGIALVFPPLLRPVRRLVLPVGAWIGRALAYVALAIIYFAVIAPLGFFAKLVGKRFMPMGKDGKAATYWIARETGPVEKVSWERQY